MTKPQGKSFEFGLIAHDAKKQELLGWVSAHIPLLASCRLVATASTGALIAGRFPELSLEMLKSGPLGGDQEMGALIANNQLGALVFIVDALSPMPHDVDVKALTRLAALYNVPLACNTATANAIASFLQRDGRNNP